MGKRWKTAASYGAVILVAFVMAINYTVFVFPNRFAPAGINGILTMIQHIFGVKLSNSNIIINIPLFIAAWLINSRPRALRSLVYSLCFSGFLMVLEQLDLSGFLYSSNVSVFVGPLVAGLLTGACGYVMHQLGACFGGTEFVAGFIHKWKPSFNFFNIIFVINVAVAISSYFVYDHQIEPVLMCIVYSFGSSFVRDYLSRREQSALRCEIITGHAQQITQKIIHKLHRTATAVSCKGAYSGEEKEILLCVIDAVQALELVKIVEEYPDSFVVMSSASRVVGNFPHLDSRGQPQRQLFDQGK